MTIDEILKNAAEEIEMEQATQTVKEDGRVEDVDALLVEIQRTIDIGHYE